MSFARIKRQPGKRRGFSGPLRSRTGPEKLFITHCLEQLASNSIAGNKHLKTGQKDIDQAHNAAEEENVLRPTATIGRFMDHWAPVCYCPWVIPGHAKAMKPNRMAHTPRTANTHQFRARLATIGPSSTARSSTSGSGTCNS